PGGARPRLRRPLLRRLYGALLPPGAGRERRRGRVLHAHQELQHAGLAGRLHGRQPRDRGGAGARQELPRLRHLPAGADRRHARLERPAALRPGDLRDLPQAAQRPLRRLGSPRLARAEAQGDHVRVGRDPRRLQGDGLARVLEAPPPGGEDRGLARHRLRRARRPLRALRAHRERAPHPPGGARHPPRALGWARAQGPRQRRVSVPAPVRAGLIGFGTIGTGVVKVLRAHRAEIARRAGRPIDVVAIADLDTTTDRGIPAAPARLTNDANSVIEDPDIPIVIELIGGYEPARRFILAAIRAGKDVVTANKALLAVHGEEIVAAAEKLALLTTLAFGVLPRFEHVPTEGIRHVEAVDIAFARELGYTIKLLAIARDRRDAVEAHVRPTMIPNGHLLADVGGNFNAIFVRGAALGPTMYYGQGAGALPTATAVIADLIAAARDRAVGAGVRVPPWGVPPRTLRRLPIRPPAALEGEYYLPVMALDRPG